MSKTGQYCDKCYYGATKQQALVELKKVTYDDYRELTDTEKELDNLKQRIVELQEEVPPEFEETFRKKFKDILA